MSWPSVQVVHLVVAPRGLGDEILALGDQQIERRGVIVDRDGGQGGGLAPDQQRHGAGVEAVALVQLARPLPLQRGPARVDLVDLRARRDYTEARVKPTERMG